MGIELTVPLTFLVAFAVSATFRRWFVVLLAAALWPVVAIGTVLGAWGTDVGDGLLWGTIVQTIATAGGAIAGWLSGRAFAS